MSADPTTQIGRMRLLTGDHDGYFEDTIYQHYLDQGLSELEGSIEVLENLINVFALMPDRERTGAYEVYNVDVEFLTTRLDQLKTKRYTNRKVPVLINAGQDNWDWMDSIFGSDN